MVDLRRTETEVQETTNRKRMKEELTVKWDRWQSTKKRGKEKQEEESCMMQTCDKKLQKSSSLAGLSVSRTVQTMHLCILMC